MTKEQIIVGLKNAAKPYEEYYIEDDLIDAINQYPEPFELVEPILEIIATNPLVDFGMPGDLVHFVEQFYKHGYEELLISSVRKNPTPHNIWMVHRCYNDMKNPKREMFAELMRDLKNDSSVSTEINSSIDEFDWECSKLHKVITYGKIHTERVLTKMWVLFLVSEKMESAYIRSFWRNQ